LEWAKDFSQYSTLKYSEIFLSSKYTLKKFTSRWNWATSFLLRSLLLQSDAFDMSFMLYSGYVVPMRIKIKSIGSFDEY